MDVDDLPVALDAWLAYGTTALHAFNGTRADSLIQLATFAHERGLADDARALYTEARSANPRVLLRGAARTLAVRTREQLRDEAADLMQWNPRMLRVGYSRSPSAWIERDVSAEQIALWTLLRDAANEIDRLHSDVASRPNEPPAPAAPDIAPVAERFEISDKELFRSRVGARPQLIDLLVEADRQVRRHFKVEKLRLAIDGPRITVHIATSQDAEQASKSYDDLRDQWWRASVTVEDRLIVAIDFV